MSRWISPEDARTLLDDGGLVVDVRSGGEYSAGCIPGSLNLPMHLIPVLAAERLPSDRPLLVCCASGARSAMAVQYLCRLGFQAHDLGPWTFHPDFA
jgi:rhodanese-related sulfurtransferase